MTSPNTRELENELRRSDKCLQAAKILIDNQLYNDAISRIYYGMFHAAKAALLSKGILTKSHESTIMFFGKVFVQTGEIEEEYGRMLTVHGTFDKKGITTHISILKKKKPWIVMKKQLDFVVKSKKFWINKESSSRHPIRGRLHECSPLCMQFAFRDSRYSPLHVQF